jgi:hypothetical protein
MTTTTTRKRVTDAQMNWMFRQGFAWYAPGEGEWRDAIYTRNNVYHWIPEHINRHREVDGGFYEAE